jgi:TonB family protein
MVFALVTSLALSGTVDANALKAVVKKNHPQIMACYEPESKLDPKLQGEVIVYFLLTETGAPKKVAIKKSALKNKNVETCLVKVFSGLTFPKAEGGNIDINYPLEFAPADVVTEVKEVQKKSGTLAPEAVRNTIMAKKDQIQVCFDGEKKKDDKLAGKVVTEFTVELDGTVSSAAVKEATLKNEAVQNCLVTFVKKLTFPKPEGESNVKVTFPFAFN